MKRTRILAATLTLLASALTARAQITSPDKLVAPPPRNPADHGHLRNIARTNVQWVWQYAAPPNGNKQALQEDARFRTLLASELRAPQSMWGTGTPLAEAAEAFLAGDGAVRSTDNRHIEITGCVADQCAQRGLLWLDTGGDHPLTVFSGLRWTEQARTTDEPNAPFFLYVFPSRELDPARLPAALKASLAAWVNHASCPRIISVLLVEPNGIPHILGAVDAGVVPVCAPPSTITSGPTQ